MALQVGKIHSPGRLQMLEKEGWGRPVGHPLLIIELETVYSFSSDPKQRGCGGKVGPTPPQSNTEMEALGLVGTSVPGLIAHLEGR